MLQTIYNLYALSMIFGKNVVVLGVKLKNNQLKTIIIRFNKLQAYKTPKNNVKHKFGPWKIYARLAT